MSTLGEAIIRRKYAPRSKQIDELISEQKQINYGPVANARLPVSVVGGDGNGENLLIRSFNDIQLNGELRTTLNSINYFEPTDVQKCIIPLIQKTTSDILCIAATGSGKSASFLIPIINRLQCLRFKANGIVRAKNTNSPLAIVIAHTKELVEQIYSFAKTLAFKTEVGVAYARGQLPFFESRRQLEDGCDILVITPGRLKEYLEKGLTLVDSVNFIVIDEADKFIVEMEFSTLLHELYDKMRKQNNTNFRTFMFSATLTDMADAVIYNYLKKDFYKVNVGIPNQAVAHVCQRICKVDNKFGYSPRIKMLLQIVKSISTYIGSSFGDNFCYDTQRTLIFVNTARICDRIAIIFSELGFRAMSVNSHRQMEQRCKAVEDFKAGKWHILIGTDVIARGMNFPKVKNIILYELPPVHRYQEYVHKIGRAGRIGEEDGCAYIFFDPKSRNDEMQTEFLIEQLENSKQHVPGFLREMQERLSEVRSKFTNECSSTYQNSTSHSEQLDDEDWETEKTSKEFYNSSWSY
ncbi:hypothetical protein Mgra_00000060 [Meloidogyne graminicola]|uniref:RNA helicase n=1 Tax=Meloidogyne graminicola TaxID=189291 RepID=A0A8T0A3W3_9BILA|nr:hypothetical protein Mgra_00000060 [Meloidogyne graminicola]